MKLKRQIVLLFLFSIVTEGCVIEETVYTYPVSQTLIVYMGGDNNLSFETEEKLSAIQRFASQSQDVKSGRISILIYQDVLSGLGSPRLLRARYDTANPEVLATYTPENSASSEVFGRILRECTIHEPASNYGLIVFSHASGWLPEGTLNNPSGYAAATSRSVIVDDKSEMEIGDFAAAIPDGMFDFIIFEACFMAGVEVAYELKDKTRYIVGSSAEILSPGFTDVYPEMLFELCSVSEVGIEKALTAAAQVYFEHYDSQEGSYRSATVSVIKTLTLDELAESVRAVRLVEEEVNIRSVQHFDRYAYRLFFDLEDYLQQTGRASDISKQIGEVVVFQKSTPAFMLSDGGFAINRHCGLTTYIEQERFVYLNNKYKELKWSKAISPT